MQEQDLKVTEPLCSTINLLLAVSFARSSATFKKNYWFNKKGDDLDLLLFTFSRFKLFSFRLFESVWAASLWGTYVYSVCHALDYVASQLFLLLSQLVASAEAAASSQMVAFPSSQLIYRTVSPITEHQPAG
jgi:hypothetical protein